MSDSSTIGAAGTVPPIYWCSYVSCTNILVERTWDIPFALGWCCAPLSFIKSSYVRFCTLCSNTPKILRGDAEYI
jgi:hypothetical protein